MHLLDNPIRSEELLEKTFDIEHRFYASSSEPLQHSELIQWTKENGDQHLIDQFNDHSLGYAENGGSLDLRQEIAKLYDANITAENIVVFPGAQTGMTLAAQALLHDGDHVIVVTPSYQSLEEGAKLAGAEVTRVALSPDNKWQIDINAIEAAIKPNTKQLFFNDPHNPSGSLMTLEIKQGLIALAKKHGLRIFSDEVYRLLEFDSNERSPAFVKFKGPIDADELAAQLLDEGILVFGPSIFDCEKNFKQYFRIGFSRRTMPAALAAFRQFVDERKNNWLRKV